MINMKDPYDYGCPTPLSWPGCWINEDVPDQSSPPFTLVTRCSRLILSFSLSHSLLIHFFLFFHLFSFLPAYIVPFILSQRSANALLTLPPPPPPPPPPPHFHCHLFFFYCFIALSFSGLVPSFASPSFCSLRQKLSRSFRSSALLSRSKHLGTGFDGFEVVEDVEAYGKTWWRRNRNVSGLSSTIRGRVFRRCTRSASAGDWFDVLRFQLEGRKIEVKVKEKLRKNLEINVKFIFEVQVED